MRPVIQRARDSTKMIQAQFRAGYFLEVLFGISGRGALCVRESRVKNILACMNFEEHVYVSRS